MFATTDEHASPLTAVLGHHHPAVAAANTAPPGQVAMLEQVEGVLRKKQYHEIMVENGMLSTLARWVYIYVCVCISCMHACIYHL